MSNLDRIVKVKKGRTTAFPVLCSANYCFFGGIIDEYPYYSKYHSNEVCHANYYHVPCAMLVNLL